MATKKSGAGRSRHDSGSGRRDPASAAPSASMQTLADSVTRSIRQSGLPPVQDWNPALSGDIDIRIERNGDWFYQGSRFTRPALVRLFAGILRRDADQAYYLVTPVEKWRIRVDDAPFVATELDIQQVDGRPVLCFTTNVGDQVYADAEHPIRVETDPTSGEPAPYILVRDRLEALIGRAVFYRLVELAQPRERDGTTTLVVASGGQEFALGHL